MLYDNAPALLHSARILEEFTQWLAVKSGELEDAAHLLGGRKWKTLAQRITGAARSGTDLSILLPDLRRLRRLLTLLYADVMGSEEMRRFMSVHPDDPRADDARRCAEALERGIAALERITPVVGRSAA